MWILYINNCKINPRFKMYTEAERFFSVLFENNTLNFNELAPETGIYKAHIMCGSQPIILKIQFEG